MCFILSEYESVESHGDSVLAKSVSGIFWVSGLVFWVPGLVLGCLDLYFVSLDMDVFS